MKVLKEYFHSWKFSFLLLFQNNIWPLWAHSNLWIIFLLNLVDLPEFSKLTFVREAFHLQHRSTCRLLFLRVKNGVQTKLKFHVTNTKMPSSNKNCLLPGHPSQAGTVFMFSVTKSMGLRTVLSWKKINISTKDLGWYEECQFCRIQFDRARDLSFI